jgi:hypothetical protein
MGWAHAVPVITSNRSAGESRRIGGSEGEFRKKSWPSEGLAASSKISTTYLRGEMNLPKFPFIFAVVTPPARPFVLKYKSGNPRVV